MRGKKNLSSFCLMFLREAVVGPAHWHLIGCLKKHVSLSLAALTANQRPAAMEKAWLNLGKEKKKQQRNFWQVGKGV